MSQFELSVREVSWGEIWPEGEDLFRTHEIELGLDDLRTPFKIDFALCAECAKIGVLKIIAAHLNNTLIGYAFWYVSPSLTSHGTICADQGPLYVRPEHRDSTVFLKIWRAGQKMLREAGVKQMLCHVTPKSPKGLEKVFEMQGGKKVEEVWEILLDD